MKPTRDDLNNAYLVIETLSDEEANFLRFLPGTGANVSVEKLSLDQLIAPRQATSILDSLAGKGIVNVMSPGKTQSVTTLGSTFELSETGLKARNLLRALKS